MKKKTFLRLIESVVFCILLICCVLFASDVLERKASRIKYEPMLERPGEIDVLFVGDSHMINGVYPMELWRDYGIASYNLACIGNTLPVSYWTMMNAFDYAQPKLVVIGINDVEFAHKLTGSSSDAHTALDGLPLTKTKVRAIEDLMDDPWVTDDDGTPYTKLKWEYYFKLGKYHTRWSEAGIRELDYETNKQKGAEMAVAVAVPRDYDIIDENMCAEESGWGFAYLRMMIEECKKRDMDVMLVHLPYPSTEEDQMAANAVYWIAEEYGVDYVDFVALDQVVDYGTDCYDSFSHLNPSGARKVTDYLGRYIADWYNVPDRRGDTVFARWEGDYEEYKAYKLGRINMQAEIKNVLMLLHDTGLSAKISVKENADLYGDEQIMRLMHNIAREHVYEEDAYAMWSDSLFPLSGLDEAAYYGDAYFAHLNGPGGAVQEYTGESAKEQAAVCFGDIPEGMQISIEVTDAQTGKSVAVMHF